MKHTRKDKIMKNSRWTVVCTAVLCMLCVAVAYGETNGKKVKISGLITGRDGENRGRMEALYIGRVLVFVAKPGKRGSSLGGAGFSLWSL